MWKYDRLWKLRALWNEFRWALVPPKLPWRLTARYMWLTFKALYGKHPDDQGKVY